MSPQMHRMFYQFLRNTSIMTLDVHVHPVKSVCSGSVPSPCTWAILQHSASHLHLDKTHWQEADPNPRGASISSCWWWLSLTVPASCSPVHSSGPSLHWEIRKAPICLCLAPHLSLFTALFPHVVWPSQERGQVCKHQPFPAAWHFGLSGENAT